MIRGDIVQFAGHGAAFVVDSGVQSFSVFRFRTVQCRLALEFLGPVPGDVLTECDEDRVIDGEVRHLLEPEYHGDPVDPGFFPKKITGRLPGIFRLGNPEGQDFRRLGT